MKLKAMTLALATLMVTLTLTAGAAQAIDTQADWLTALDVKMALLDKLGTDSLHVDAVSRDGAVTLAGTVAKRETMELAGTVARTVTGVRDVDNAIRLEAAMANPSKPAAAVGEADAEVKDAMLETKLRLTLIQKMGADGFRIGTDAANGVVTLAFEHDLETARRDTAKGIAAGLVGVSKVISIEKLDEI